ncbi:MAG: response regulator [Lentisphaeraceae bacterium]|nr:response regulator [Lentisphaeraceae bacterium]
MKILIVDDDKLILKSLTRNLFTTDSSLEVETAQSVAETKEILSQEEFDCIISDLNMPEQNGLSLIHYLKNESIQTPLIIMTGSPEAESAVECMKSGAVDFISKPFLAEKIIEKINSHCSVKNKVWGKGFMINDYCVKNMISETLSSLVFIASKKDSDETFIVKALRKEGLEFNEITLRRFQLEIDILRQLNHPNIVNIIEFGTTDLGIPYIIMPYVTGTNLGDCIDELDDISFIDIMLSIAETLVHVHCQNLVHRDIKPENIMISNGRPVLLDFGVALAKYMEDIESDDQLDLNALLQLKLDDMNAHITHENVIVGTPNYMAPEAFVNSHKVDYRADIYSLGCIIYRYVYKQGPYEGDGIYDVIRNLMEKTDAQLYKGSIFDPLIKELIDKNPNKRIDSVLTLSEELYKIKEELLRS